MTARLTAENKRSLAHDNPAYLPALDGLRWLMVFSVACFHFWQQSWWSPDIRILGLRIDLTPWLRTGYIWVDGMLLLSGFLLYLPLGQPGMGATPCPGFYWRRVARIPSYLFNLLVVYLVIAGGTLKSTLHAIRLAGPPDIHPSAVPFSNPATPLNGVLWTPGVEAVPFDFPCGQGLEKAAYLPGGAGRPFPPAQRAAPEGHGHAGQPASRLYGCLPQRLGGLGLCGAERRLEKDQMAAGADQPGLPGCAFSSARRLINKWRASRPSARRRLRLRRAFIPGVSGGVRGCKMRSLGTLRRHFLPVLHVAPDGAAARWGF